METTAGKIPVEQPEPTLAVKRSPLPIDEYAALKGISTKVVEEYAKQGIVHLRKYKGKTFVIDATSGAYPSEDEYEIYTPPGFGDLGHTEDLSDTIVTPDLQRPEIIDETLEFEDDLIELERQAEAVAPAPYEYPYENAWPGASVQQTRPKRIWKVAAVLLGACFCAALVAGSWLYNNRKTQIYRLNGAYANITQFVNDSEKTNQFLKITQSELDNSITQNEQLQNELNRSKVQVNLIEGELDNSKADLTTLREDFVQTEQKFKLIQQRNAAAAKQLHEQIQKFSEQLAELTRRRQLTTTQKPLSPLGH